MPGNFGFKYEHGRPLDDDFLSCLAKECHALASRLFPINRSLTGNGVRETLRILQEYLPALVLSEVPSGTQVFDWVIPPEWDCRAGYLELPDGSRMADFTQHNLHVMGYAAPVNARLSLPELEKMVFTLPEQPDVIPYVTSYYERRTGFCLSWREWQELQRRVNSAPSGKRYVHAVVDSSFDEHGSLTYGEWYFPGATEDEILCVTDICHPSLANNECSGPALATLLASWVGERPRRFSYRFLFVPETIGTLAYLAGHLPALRRHVRAGFTLSCVGDNRAYSFVRTRYGDTLTDRVLGDTLAGLAPCYHDYSFLDRGSDERQFNAPGIDLPICAFCRSKFGTYPEYHTSADDLNLISEAGFAGSMRVMTTCLQVLEGNYRYRLLTLGEPQLGRRGLYPTLSRKECYGDARTMTNFLAYCDGRNDLLEIARRIGRPAYTLLSMAEKLRQAGLIAADSDKQD